MTLSTSSAERPATTGQPRILYVEDEILVALDCLDLFAEEGLADVTAAHSFEDALPLVEGGAFDLAVLDVNLGGGRTSIPLARVLQSRGSRIIFASGYNNCDEMVGEIDCQVVGKPIVHAELMAAIRRALG